MKWKRTPEQMYRHVIDHSTVTGSGCWECSLSSSRGYPHAWFRGKLSCVSRTMLSIRSGVRPSPKLFCCHKCDNKKCVNPRHLFWGTQKENMQDCARKRRTDRTRKLKGDAHPAAKVSSLDIPIMMELSLNGMPQRKIAAIYGISQSAVWRIVSGNSWKCLAND